MSEPAREPECCRAALTYAEGFGLPVVAVYPVVGDADGCGQPGCTAIGKHPIGGTMSASSDGSILRSTYARHPLAGVGIVTGTASRIVVVETDGAEGEATLARLIAEHGAEWPTTWKVRTARGWHHYFACSVRVSNRAGARGGGLGVGVDVRGEGGFVVAPPSVHASGHVYVWEQGHSPQDIPLADLPAWLLALLVDPPREVSAQQPLPPLEVGATRAQRWAAAALAQEVEAVRNAPEGTRNQQLNTSAFNMGAKGALLDAGEVKRTLVAAAMQAGLGEFEAQKTVRSGYAAGLKKDGSARPTRDLPGYGTRSTSSSSPSDSPEWPDETPAKGSADSGSFGPEFKLYTTREIFAPLPEQRWMVEGLQIGPGRPTLFVGFGGSAKTLAVQSLALSSAAGHPVWGRFDCARQSVLHLDYEQGEYASRKRYQRLAVGHGIDWRELENRVVYAELPRVYLDKQGAAEVYKRLCEGFDIVIVDSLRGAAPFTDENDSSFRGALDVLTYVSTCTGCCFIVLHHAGKPRVEKGQQTADVRMLARGTGAIFDAAGCVFNFQTIDGARLVRQAKTPAESTGAGLDLFELAIEDVNADGVRVNWARPKPVDEVARAATKFERDAGMVIAAVQKRMGGTANQVIAKCGLARGRALDVLKALADEGRLELTTGPNKAKIYRVPPTQGGKP